MEHEFHVVPPPRQGASGREWPWQEVEKWLWVIHYLARFGGDRYLICLLARDLAAGCELMRLEHDPDEEPGEVRVCQDYCNEEKIAAAVRLAELGWAPPDHVPLLVLAHDRDVDQDEPREVV